MSAGRSMPPSLAPGAQNQGVKRKKCTKLGYATRRDAEIAIGGMARRFRFTFKKPYWCASCRAYHVTSTPPVKGRRKQW